MPSPLCTRAHTPPLPSRLPAVPHTVAPAGGFGGSALWARRDRWRHRTTMLQRVRFARARAGPVPRCVPQAERERLYEYVPAGVEVTDMMVHMELCRKAEEEATISHLRRSLLTSLPHSDVCANSVPIL